MYDGQGMRVAFYSAFSVSIAAFSVWLSVARTQREVADDSNVTQPQREGWAVAMAHVAAGGGGLLLAWSVFSSEAAAVPLFHQHTSATLVNSVLEMVNLNQPTFLSHQTIA